MERNPRARTFRTDHASEWCNKTQVVPAEHTQQVARTFFVVMVFILSEWLVAVFRVSKVF